MCALGRLGRVGGGSESNGVGRSRGADWLVSNVGRQTAVESNLHSANGEKCC